MTSFNHFILLLLFKSKQTDSLQVHKRVHLWLRSCCFCCVLLDRYCRGAESYRKYDLLTFQNLMAETQVLTNESCCAPCTLSLATPTTAANSSTCDAGNIVQDFVKRGRRNDGNFWLTHSGGNAADCGPYLVEVKTPNTSRLLGWSDSSKNILSKIKKKKKNINQSTVQKFQS